MTAEMGPLEVAKSYCQRGWSVVPVPYKEKGPKIREWTKLRLNKADLPRYFDLPAKNIGVLLGEPSGGLVDIDDHAIVGGLVAIHQHVRIGAHCIIGGGSIVRMDIPPYVMAAGNKARLYRLNSVGLRRQGFSKEALDEITTAYKVLFKSSLTLKKAMEKLSNELPDSEHAKTFLEFLNSSKRGIVRLKTKRRRGGEGSEEDD